MIGYTAAVYMFVCVCWTRMEWGELPFFLQTNRYIGCGEVCRNGFIANDGVCLHLLEAM